jgi:hypothetical protein
MIVSVYISVKVMAVAMSPGFEQMLLFLSPRPVSIVVAQFVRMCSLYVIEACDRLKPNLYPSDLLNSMRGTKLWIL